MQVKHPMDTVARVIESRPGHVWTYSEISAASGLDNETVGSAAYKLATRSPRADEFERLDTGQIRFRSTEFDPEQWTDVRTMQRAYILYRLYERAVDSEGRVMTQPEKLVEQYGLKHLFKWKNAYSVMAVRYAAKWLNEIGSTKQNGPRVKLLVRHPQNITNVALPLPSEFAGGTIPTATVRETEKPVVATLPDKPAAQPTSKNLVDPVRVVQDLVTRLTTAERRIARLLTEVDGLKTKNAELQEANVLVRENLAMTSQRLRKIQSLKVGDLVDSGKL